ncbi:MAG: PilN domain-containing protein [Gaiellaceae bacterium]
MRAVNLLPRDVQQLRGGSSRLPLLLAVGGVAAVTVASASVWLSASSTASEKQDELANVEAAIARVPVGAGQGVAHAAITQERTDRIAAFQVAVSGRIAFDRLLRDISLVLPDDVWLTGITANAPEPSAVPPPAGGAASADSDQSVTIQGSTFSYDAVAKALVRLSAVPSLANVRLTASDRVEQQATPAQGKGAKRAPKQKAVVTFSIVASVPTGVGS